MMNASGVRPTATLNQPALSAPGMYVARIECWPDAAASFARTNRPPPSWYSKKTSRRSAPDSKSSQNNQPSGSRAGQPCPGVWDVVSEPSSPAPLLPVPVEYPDVTHVPSVSQPLVPSSKGSSPVSPPWSASSSRSSDSCMRDGSAPPSSSPEPSCSESSSSSSVSVPAT